MVIRHYMLGFDMGTSGLKCVAVEPETGQTVSVYTEWNLLCPHPGYVEIDPETIWQAVLSSISELKRLHHITPEQINSIGSCALCPGLIAMDKEGRPLTKAIIFMDSRSEAQARGLERQITKARCYEITGNQIMAGASSVTTMAWLKLHEPVLYDKTACFAHLPSWLGWRLTGEMRMDRSNAAGTCLYDIHNQHWSPWLAEKAGIDLAKLPELAQGYELLGTLNNPELIELGLPIGIPVAVGAGDTACTALGLGIRKHGEAFISFGTSSVLTAISHKDNFDPRIASRSHIFENTWALAGAMSGTGASMKWFRDNFCQDYIEQEHESGISAYQRIDELAAQAGPSAKGLTFLPYLNGERSPVFDPKARGVFLGVSLQSDRGVFARAILEGAAFGLRQILEIQERLLGVQIDNLPVAGGGSKSAVWMQIIADVLGRNLYAANTAEAGAVGAAILGGIAGGIVPKEYRLPEDKEQRKYVSNFKMHDQYDGVFERYQKLYPAVKELF